MIAKLVRRSERPQGSASDPAEIKIASEKGRWQVMLCIYFGQGQEAYLLTMRLDEDRADSLRFMRIKSRFELGSRWNALKTFDDLTILEQQ